MASLPTPRVSTSAPKRDNAEEDSNPILGEKSEEMSKRRKLDQAWLNLVYTEERGSELDFDVLNQRGIEALNARNFTEAVKFFDRALRIRISEEGKSGPESVKTVLKHTDEWFAKGKEICESAKTSPADLRAMLKKTTQKITNEILEATPEGDSAEKDQIHSIIAEADSKIKYEAISDCSTVVDQLRNETRKMLRGPVYTCDPDSVIKTFFHYSEMMDMEFSTLAALYKTDLAAGGRTNPSTTDGKSSS